ncbi:hypothetical protein C8J56DRAFT_965458 [Mycena floridula]|nr:hypothetical protein C8J56DRAFT_965458 [Mycena floridula]
MAPTSIKKPGSTTKKRNDKLTVAERNAKAEKRRQGLEKAATTRLRNKNDKRDKDRLATLFKEQDESWSQSHKWDFTKAVREDRLEVYLDGLAARYHQHFQSRSTDSEKTFRDHNHRVTMEHLRRILYIQTAPEFPAHNIPKHLSRLAARPIDYFKKDGLPVESKHT